MSVSEEPDGAATARKSSKRGRRPGPIAKMPSMDSFKRSLRRPSTPRAQRIVFLGHVEVGKTAIIWRLISDSFPEEYEPTMEDLTDSKMNLRGEIEETVTFVDTNGDPSDEVKGLRRGAIDSGNAFVVVFSVQNRQSFERVRALLDEILASSAKRDVKQEVLGSERRIVLVGNQAGEKANRSASLADLDEEIAACPLGRAVDETEARALAGEYGILEYIEVSARIGTNVQRIPRRLHNLYQKKSKKKSGGSEEAETSSFLSNLKKKLSIKKSRRIRGTQRGHRLESDASVASTSATSGHSANNIAADGEDGPHKPHTTGLRARLSRRNKKADRNSTVSTATVGEVTVPQSAVGEVLLCHSAV